MFDIHYHLLFGLDDGPRDIETSLSMASASIIEGVTHIVATPHANNRYPFRLESNREQIAVLRERLEGKVILGLGCDFHLSYENLEDLERTPKIYTINETQYLLVEFSDFGIPQNADQMFYEILSAGIVPIITHPERNPILGKYPERLDPWIHAGCLVQITAASFEGRFGQKSQGMAFDLVRRNKAHVIASDAHNLSGRPPAMKQAFSLIEKRFGHQTAVKLCADNPAAIFYGKPIPHYEVVDHSANEQVGSATRLLRRIFGR